MLQNVILTQDVITIAAKCNKVFNGKCHNFLTQIVLCNANKSLKSKSQIEVYCKNAHGMCILKKCCGYRVGVIAEQ